MEWNGIWFRSVVGSKNTRDLLLQRLEELAMQYLASNQATHWHFSQPFSKENLHQLLVKSKLTADCLCCSPKRFWSQFSSLICVITQKTHQYRECYPMVRLGKYDIFLFMGAEESSHIQHASGDPNLLINSQYYYQLPTPY